MDDLNELKKIWLSADTTTLPDTAEILRAIKKYRSTNMVKKVRLVVLSVLLSVFMIIIVVSYRSVMITTRIGELFFMMACALLIFTNVRSLRRLYRVKDFNNKEFLNYLEEVQRNRVRYYNRTQVWGMMLCYIGLLFYMYEPACTGRVMGIVAYALTIAFTLFSWFYIRPRTYRRNAEKLNEQIKKMSEIAKQF